MANTTPILHAVTNERPAMTVDEWSVEPTRYGRFAKALGQARDLVKGHPGKTFFAVTAIGIVVAGLIAKRRR